MTLIQWRPDFELGIRRIDEQHQRLVALINTLHEVSVEAHQSEVVPHVLSEVADYCVAHFSLEESLMRESGYPRYYQHKCRHMELVAKVHSFQKVFTTEEAPPTLELLDFLRDWLVRHILSADKELAPHLIARGIL